MIQPEVTERDAERTVIGIMLKRAEKIREIRERVRADDFANDIRRGLFVAALATYSTSGDVDLYTVSVEYSKARQGQDATEELIACAETYTSAALTDTYCGLLVEYSQRRRLRRIADELTQLAGKPDTNIQEAVDSARRNLLGIMRCEGEVKTRFEVMADALEYAEELAKGKVVPCVSGIPALDDFTGGFYPGEMTIIGARPSVGKTAVALVTDTANACVGKCVLMASAEMDSKQLGQRFLAESSNVNSMKIRRPKSMSDGDWGSLAAGLVKQGQYPCAYLFERNVDKIIGTARRRRDMGECDILLVDYVQLLTTNRSFDADRMRVEYISHELKALSVELRIPVVALAQLARPQRGEVTVPGLESLSDSSALEKDADSVILLHRPETSEDRVFNMPQCKGDEQILSSLTGTGKRLVYFIVAKQRQGTIGMCAQAFDGAFGRFTAINRGGNGR